MNWVRSSTQVLDFRFAVSRTRAGKNPAALGPNASALYGIPGLPTDPRISGGLPKQLTIDNAAGSKALSAYDQPVTNTTSLIYQLPFGKGRHYASSMPGVADFFLGGWELSSVNNAYSGQPITIQNGPIPPSAFQVSGIQQDFRGANNYRVNVSGDPVNHSPNHVLHFFNLANIQVPTDPAHPYGNSGRNIARGDPFWQWDFAANKTFTLPWESMRLQFRAEMFNLLNHTNFLPPNSVCGASNATTGACTTGSFGQITSTFDPRLVQFGLKLSF